jgi:GMP reductase
MRILDEVKLDFKDVLFVPKRSALRSRSDVDLNRNYVFKHSGATYSGVPIMASNMDGVGTFEMSRTLRTFPLFTCLVKSYELHDWNVNYRDLDMDSVAVSTGIGETDWLNLKAILFVFKDIKYICIDVANGYSEHFVEFVKKARANFPDKIIIAGSPDKRKIVKAKPTTKKIVSNARKLRESM